MIIITNLDGQFEQSVLVLVTSRVTQAVCDGVQPVPINTTYNNMHNK